MTRPRPVVRCVVVLTAIDCILRGTQAPTALLRCMVHMEPNTPHNNTVRPIAGCGHMRRVFHCTAAITNLLAKAVKNRVTHLDALELAAKTNGTSARDVGGCHKVVTLQDDLPLQAFFVEPGGVRLAITAGIVVAVLDKTAIGNRLIVLPVIRIITGVFILLEAFGKCRRVTISEAPAHLLNRSQFRVLGLAVRAWCLTRLCRRGVRAGRLDGRKCSRRCRRLQSFHPDLGKLGILAVREAFQVERKLCGIC